MKKILLIIITVVVIVPASWFLLHQYESKEPVIKLELPSKYLKKSYEMSLSVSDQGKGLREVKVAIEQEGKEKSFFSTTYGNAGIKNLFFGSGVKQDSFDIPVEFWKYGMSDGKAVIRVYASDYSWHGWNKGNRVHAEKEVIIDTKPPKINVLTKKHNVERGGTGLVIYRLHEKGIKSGVKVETISFPAIQACLMMKTCGPASSPSITPRGRVPRSLSLPKIRPGIPPKEGFIITSGMPGTKPTCSIYPILF